MNWIVIKANKEQVDKLYEKHCKAITDYKFVPKEGEKMSRGWVTLTTTSDKEICFQMSPGGTPSFVEFRRFGARKDVRYDVDYPKDNSRDMTMFLKKWGEKAIKEFWEGSEI